MGRKLNNRRGGSAIWQWVIIGVVLGFACSAITVLALLTVGVFNLEGTSVANEPTQTPFVVTATNDPNAPTTTPQVIVVTNTPDAQLTEQAEQAAQIMQPTPTAIPPTPESALPTATPTLEPLIPGGGTTGGTTGGGTAGGDTSAPAGEVPALLQGILTELISIPGGTFQMGTTSQEIALAVQQCELEGGACTAAMGADSLPQHPVTLDPFRIERTEVTNRQYVAFLNSLGAGSHNNACFNQACIVTNQENEFSVIQFDSANYTVSEFAANFPVTGVSWYGAQAYCQAVGRRLPTEAEWERAARGDTGFIYPWGDTWDPNRAVFRGEGRDPGAVEVGSIAGNASPYLVLDMAGNVSEWVADNWSPTYYAQPEAQGPNPTGPVSGTDKVFRGGSWNTRPFFLRTVHRQHDVPTVTYLFNGFRCADDLEDEAPAAAPAAGGNPDALGTVDPASLGVPEEEPTLSSVPTLPPAPGSNSDGVVPPNPPGE